MMKALGPDEAGPPQSVNSFRVLLAVAEQRRLRRLLVLLGFP